MNEPPPPPEPPEPPLQHWDGSRGMILAGAIVAIIIYALLRGLS